MLTQGMLTQGTLFAVTISPAPLPWGRSTSAPAGDRTTCQELAGTWANGTKACLVEWHQTVPSGPSN
jgi:hypothetical protein